MVGAKRMTYKKIVLILLILIFMCPGLSAQVVFAPLQDDVYGFLDRLEIKGLTDNNVSDIKPLSRNEIYHYLRQAQANPKFEKLNEIDKKKLKSYLRLYLPEKNLFGKVSRLKKIKEEVINFFSDNKKTSNYNSDSTSTSLKLPLEFYSGNSYLYINPTFHLKYNYNSSDSSYFNKNYFLITAGARMFGYLGENIAWGFRAVNNRVDGNEFDLKRIDNKDQGVGSLITRDTYYDEIDAYISLSSKYADLVVGKFSNYWGNGQSGSITISNRAPSYPQIMLKTGFSDWLKFVYFHGWLESNLLHDSLSYNIHEGDRTFHREFYKNKYIAAHRLEIAPYKNLKISLSEMLYYGESEPKMVYFIPIMFFWSAQHQTNDQDNEELALSLEWIPTNYCKLYGSLLVDDIRLTKIFDKNEALNYIGYQIGSNLIEPFFPGLDFIVEYTHINPWVYTHKFPVNRATSDGYIMGYWSGQNSDNLFLKTKFQLAADQNISLSLSHYRKGAQDSVYKQYECPPSEKFLYGHQYTRNTMVLQYKRKLFSDINALFGLQYQKIKVNQQNIAKAEQGYYVNPVYYKNDFDRWSFSFSLSYGFKH